MITPPTLLRDTAIAGLLLAAFGSIWGVGTASAIAAGAVAGLISLWLLARATAVLGQPASFVTRLLLQHLVAATLFLLLASRLPLVPVLTGFCAVIAALSFRAFAAILHPPAELR